MLEKRSTENEVLEDVAGDPAWAEEGYRFMAGFNRYFGGIRAVRRFIEAEAKRRGIHKLYYGSKLHKDCGRLFEFLKMEPIETYYSKWIGD